MLPAQNLISRVQGSDASCPHNIITLEQCPYNIIAQVQGSDVPCP